MTGWIMFAVGVVVGAVGGGYVGRRWDYWLEESGHWLVSILAAVGLIAVVAVGIAWANGWRP